MATVEQIINGKLAATEQFTDLAAQAVAAITQPSVVAGYSQLSIDPASFDATYKPPNKDATPMPVYQEPGVKQPNSPSLVNLHGINMPPLPAAPTVSTAGLFQNTKPSGNIPEFTAIAPQLHGDEIYNAIAAVGLPVLDKVDLPVLAPLAIRPAPTVTVPGFTPGDVPDGLAAPADYARYYGEQYQAALPVMRGLVNDQMDLWMGKYAPGYDDMRAQLDEAIGRGIRGEPLPHEAALYSRHQARIRREHDGARQAIMDGDGFNGWVVPPGRKLRALDTLDKDAVRALAGASTEVYIEINRAAIQKYQFAVSLADGQVGNIRANLLQFADKLFQAIDASQRHALNLANLLVTRFEHDKARAEFALALMRALDDRFKVLLAAALAELTVYEAELKALALRSDIDTKQLDAAKIKVDIQKLEVDKYSAIIDAIAKRAVGDELKVKQFGILADTFKTQIQAVLAEYDAYKAANDGDRSKLQGELAKLDIFNAQMKGVELQIGAEAAVQRGDIASNAAKLDQYNAELNARETAFKIALQKFTAEAELKKLGLDVYRTDAEVSRSVFEGDLRKSQWLNEAIIHAFNGNVRSKVAFYELLKEYEALKLNAQNSIADGYTRVAAAAQAATNGVASLVTNN